ncbi:MAG: Flp family type IVb pilin [Pyrinomonadaceae bacterium]|nr:Flp family type IVb pilin [Pyrinomonadaceae bacterium]
MRPAQAPTDFVQPVGEGEMIRRFLKDETGLELSEYAVAAALIALTIVGTITTLGDNITNRIKTLANTVG